MGRSDAKPGFLHYSCQRPRAARRDDGLDGVLTVILEQLGSAGERPHPNLPPEGEGANSQEPRT